MTLTETFTTRERFSIDQIHVNMLCVSTASVSGTITFKYCVHCKDCYSCRFFFFLGGWGGLLIGNFLSEGLVKYYLFLYFFMLFQLSDAKKSMKSLLNKRVPLMSMKRNLMKLS